MMGWGTDASIIASQVSESQPFKAECDLSVQITRQECEIIPLEFI